MSWQFTQNKEMERMEKLDHVRPEYDSIENCVTDQSMVHRILCFIDS